MSKHINPIVDQQMNMNSSHILYVRAGPDGYEVASSPAGSSPMLFTGRLQKSKPQLTVTKIEPEPKPTMPAMSGGNLLGNVSFSSVSSTIKVQLPSGAALDMHHPHPLSGNHEVFLPQLKSTCTWCHERFSNDTYHLKQQSSSVRLATFEQADKKWRKASGGKAVGTISIPAPGQRQSQYPAEVIDAVVLTALAKIEEERRNGKVQRRGALAAMGASSAAAAASAGGVAGSVGGGGGGGGC